MVISPHSERTVRQWLSADIPKNREGSVHVSLKNRNVSLRPRLTLQGDYNDIGYYWESQHWNVPLQGDRVDGPGGPSADTEQTTTFVDEKVGEVVDAAPPNPQHAIDYSVDASLADFLKRPVLAKTYTWTEGTALDETFYPWNEFFDNAVIKNKIYNFAYARCTLKVKFLLNSSPFYYSMAGAFYRPLQVWDPCPIIETSSYDGHFVPRSQRPCLWIYPQNNEGGEITLPFFYHKDFIDITDASDLTDMGDINLRSIVNLLNANSVSGSDVTIQVYIWAENVELAGPTIAAPMQGDRVEKKDAKNSVKKEGKTPAKPKIASGSSDEYNDKPVSKVASAVAAASGMLSAVPVIGPFMTATSAAASTVATIAGALGFSDPPEIDNVKAFKNLPFHTISTTEISAPISKLTLDCKNELSVDPRLANILPDDELSIQYLASRESLIYWSSWDSTDAAESSLFLSLVKPNQMRRDGATNYVSQMTPMCMLQNMFSYWRGDIIYRIRFICTQYHRGRVRVTWDPTGNIYASSASQTSNYNRIIDIAEETDVYIRVPYLQETSFKKTDKSIAENTGATTATRNDSLDNGYLSMRVFTQQTSPVANAPIYFVVSVMAGDNFELAAPSNIPINHSMYALQGDYVTDNQVTPLFDVAEDSATLNLTYMGEKIVSCRQLMRRGNLSRSQILTATTTQRYTLFRSKMSRLPLYYGYDLDGINEAAGTLVPASDFNFNYVNNTYINWIGMCFIGNRGSMQWHVNVDSAAPIGYISLERNLDVGNLSTALYNNYASVATTDTIDEANRIVFLEQSANSGGIEVLNQHTQTGLTAECPMYSRFKFLTNTAETRTLGSFHDETKTDTIQVRASFKPNTGDTFKTDASLVQYWCSSGTDFTYLFFLNVPSQVDVAAVPAAKDT